MLDSAGGFSHKQRELLSLSDGRSWCMDERSTIDSFTVYHKRRDTIDPSHDRLPRQSGAK